MCILIKKSMLYAFLLSIIVTITSAPIFSQDSTSKANSLFADFGDSCSPPCWFGLTPGLSTKEDVKKAFTKNNKTLLINGEPVGDQLFANTLKSDYEQLFQKETSSIQWRVWGEPDLERPSPVNDALGFEDNVLHWIRVSINHTITMREAIEILGTPNDVRNTAGIYKSSFALYYEYEQASLIVFTVDDIANNYKNTEDLFHQHKVQYLYYYGQKTASPIEKWISDFYPDPWNDWLHELGLDEPSLTLIPSEKSTEQP